MRAMFIGTYVAVVSGGSVRISSALQKRMNRRMRQMLWLMWKSDDGGVVFGPVAQHHRLDSVATLEVFEETGAIVAQADVVDLGCPADGRP